MKDEWVSCYDVIAEYYDYDMGLNNPGKDIAFYREYAVRARGSVLELGCGTGRITIPLVKAGCNVTGLDCSRPMLEQMWRKIETQLSPEEKGRLNYLCMDMREFDLQTRFALIICPFAAFTYLVEESDQARFFQRVKKHLAHDGLFIVDSFVPHHDVCCLPADHVFFDYRREI
jgi:cyclopropane fatty-acyl-phospholipid synthase-like methyltransferase